LKHHRPCGRPPFECIALLRQGGGALGAYQGGGRKTWPRLAFTRLNRRISIGAINAALLAGNPPEE
jgi:NTE family protein